MTFHPPTPFLPKRQIFQVKRHFCILRKRESISEIEKKKNAGGFFSLAHKSRKRNTAGMGTNFEEAAECFYCTVLYSLYNTDSVHGTNPEAEESGHGF